MALEHPGYAFAGAVAAPLALGLGARLLPQTTTPTTRGFLLAGLAAGAAVAAYSYASRPGISENARAAAEGAALTAGAGAILLGTSMLLGSPMLTA